MMLVRRREREIPSPQGQKFMFIGGFVGTNRLKTWADHSAADQAAGEPGETARADIAAPLAKPAWHAAQASQMAQQHRLADCLGEE